MAHPVAARWLAPFLLLLSGRRISENHCKLFDSKAKVNTSDIRYQMILDGPAGFL